MPMQSLAVPPLTIGPAAPLTIIAGPCAAESFDLCVQVGSAVRDRCAQLGFSYIFKASFDKANRSSVHSNRGPGLDKGLELLAAVKQKLGVPITTDIHESDQAAPAAKVVDLLQIPAFLCRQTDLLLAAGLTGCAVNVKKGQFVSPSEMGNAVKKLAEGFAAGGHAPKIMLTERGTFFGYHRLVNDFVGVGDMMDLGWPVCFDVTHSTQRPGEGATSGGRPERAPLLARCAVAAGVQALFIETHPDPAHALSDAATMLPLERTLTLLGELATLHKAMTGVAR
ncbi:MAG: 3-deoxy-8-phosphooctulonate synthase [Planctomycetota bacterium]|nr:3-deoxy-8-phosphooctulonate synthase [Planctomycetota bacterium]